MIMAALALTTPLAIGGGGIPGPSPPTRSPPAFPGAPPSPVNSDGCTATPAARSACAAASSSLDANWTEVSGTGPPARYRSSMAYDPVVEEVILFGGCGRVCALADTWAFAGGVWTNLTGTTGQTPAGRYGASMAYYPGTSGNGYLVMFGGFGSNGYLGDTWTFAGGRWTLLAPAGISEPPARADASLTYDPTTNVLVLFGGSTNFEGRAYLNDTWTFSDGSWIELSPATAPPARADAAMAYDPSVGAVVLFGGAIATGIAKDTWEFAGGNWTRILVPTAPTSRAGAVLVYDDALSALVLFGGLGRVGFDADTWTFVGTTWVEQSLDPSPPGASGAAAAYDGTDGYLVLYGGWNLSAFSGATWVLGTNVTLGPSASSGSGAGSAPLERAGPGATSPAAVPVAGPRPASPR